MLEHLTQKQFDDYFARQLTVADLIVVSDHLASCEVCQRKVRSDSNGDSTFADLHEEILGAETESAHLSPTQTAEYVDKNLTGDSLQEVTDHLTACARCELAVEDLRNFRNEIAPSLDHEFRPATASARSSNWWQRMSGFLPPVFRSSPLPVFGTAFALLLLGVIGWYVWRAIQDSQPKPEIVVAPSPQPVSPPLPAPTQPEQTPQVVVAAQLNDGRRHLTLDQQGNLSGADDLPAAYRNLAKQALTTQRIEKSSQLNGLGRAGSTLMGPDDPRGQFAVLEPVGNVVMTDRPTFRWSTIEGASDYVVEVYDEQFKLVANSPQLTSGSWSPQALPRGKVYAWQVKATKEGQEITSPRPPAPQAKFRVLDQTRVNEIARAKRAYGTSHLTLGLLYADAGLLREAEQEFRALQRANPGSEIARSLLRQVQALRASVR